MSKKTVVILVILILIVVMGFVFLKPQEQFVQEQPALDNLQNINSQITTMQIETLNEGIGEGAKVGDNIAVHYTGTLENGTKFDSSLDRNEVFEYTLGQNRVIQGWEKGLLGMKVGEKRKLVIPPELAYGPNGVPPVIPPNATLNFEIEMMSINGK